MAFEVFVSYSTKDLGTARGLDAWIQHAGAKAFIAEYAVGLGAALTPTIEAALRRCDLFVPLWSEHAAASAWVPQEIGFARGIQKPILPLVLDQTATLPAFIGDLKYLRLMPEPAVAVQKFYTSLHERIRAKQFGDSVAVLLAIGVVLAAVASGGAEGAP